MSNEYAIEVENISKDFKVYIDKGSQLKEKVLFHNRNRYEKRCVLNDISFKVKKGEAIGLIGHNGCGKSTTLKLLTKIMYPDTGTITMRGRVSALIELGAGFHPDMSGRENIYTNAAIFGLNKKEIDEKIEDIIAFSELEDYIDNPVRTYSSGMYMRLAFSVAINVDADILLIDEILAVGDAAFQAKCFNRLKEIKAQGTTIVIVSHSLSQIEKICERTIWIHEGYVKAEGIPEEVHQLYLDYVADYRQQVAAKEVQRQEEKKEITETEIVKKRKGNGAIRIEKVKVFNGENVAQTILKTGDSVKIEVYYKVYEKEQNPIIAVGILRLDGTLCYSTNTKIDGFVIDEMQKDGKVIIEIPELNLLPDGYCMDVAFWNSAGQTIDYKTQACKFEMISNILDSGVTRILHKWRLEE